MGNYWGSWGILFAIKSQQETKKVPQGGRHFQKIYGGFLKVYGPIIIFLEMPSPMAMGKFLCLLLRLDVSKHQLSILQNYLRIHLDQYITLSFL